MIMHQNRLVFYTLLMNFKTVAATNTFSNRFFNTVIFFLCLVTNGVWALEPDSKTPQIAFRDSTTLYQTLLNDDTDDLMEDHPAADLYNNIWTSTRLNPYRIPIDSLPDSIQICLRNFVLPVQGRVTSHFGTRRYRFHYGIDLKLNTGDSVAAAFSGKVRIIDFDRRGYGHYVVIRHDNGLETVYAHLSRVLVTLEQTVAAGEIIALGGNTGRSTGPHLHFEVRFLGNALNPAKLFDFHYGTPLFADYLVTKQNSFYYQRELKALSAAKFYRVRRGDTLGHIARRNGTSVRALCRLNGISPNKILRIGQRIRVR